MRTRIKRMLAILVVLSMGSISLRADDADSGEARLRQTLRDTMLQLRQAQTDLSNLQAAQAAQADSDRAIKDQLALFAKHSSEEKADAAVATATMKAKLADDAARIAKLGDLLAQWKAAAEKLNKAEQAAEGIAAKAAANAALLERRVEDLTAKNEELYRLGNEILLRYEKFSLGEQFLAREPFIGRTRAELETQIQDYSDQIQAEKAPQ